MKYVTYLNKTLNSVSIPSDDFDKYPLHFFPEYAVHCKNLLSARLNGHKSKDAFVKFLHS